MSAGLAGLIGKQRLDVAGGKSARIDLHRQGFQRLVRPPTTSRMRDRNGSVRSAICVALHATAPSSCLNPEKIAGISERV
jgi:hypothetical protein